MLILFLLYKRPMALLLWADRQFPDSPAHYLIAIVFIASFNFYFPCHNDSRIDSREKSVSCPVGYFPSVKLGVPKRYGKKADIKPRSVNGKHGVLHSHPVVFSAGLDCNCLPAKLHGVRIRPFKWSDEGQMP